MGVPSSSVSRIAARTIQVLAAGVVMAGGTTADLWTLPVYGVGLLVAPPVLGHAFRYRLEPLQRTWFSLALAAHPVGVLYDLYHAVPLYDNLAHLAFASLVAGLAYLPLVGIVAGGSSRRVGPGVHTAALLTVLALGVGWEAYELHVSYLVVPGPEDTVADLTYDLVGWLLVAPRWRSLLSVLPRRLAVRVNADVAV